MKICYGSIGPTSSTSTKTGSSEKSHFPDTTENSLSEEEEDAKQNSSSNEDDAEWRLTASVSSMDDMPYQSIASSGERGNHSTCGIYISSCEVSFENTSTRSRSYSFIEHLFDVVVKDHQVEDLLPFEFRKK